jgi:hypothetical protein
MFEVADEYRRKAEACRRLADLSPESERRARWIEQAAEWDRVSAKALKQSRRKAVITARSPRAAETVI